MNISRLASPAPLHVDSCGSDRHRRLPARLEASARGPAACSAPAGSPQAAGRSGVGGGGFHVNISRLASPAPLHVDSCGSDRHRRLPARLEASARGPAACSAPAGSPQAAGRSGVGGGGFHVNRFYFLGLIYFFMAAYVFFFDVFLYLMSALSFLCVMGWLKFWLGMLSACHSVPS